MYSQTRKRIERDIRDAIQRGHRPEDLLFWLNQDETREYLLWRHVHLRPSMLEEAPHAVEWRHHGATVRSILPDHLVQQLASNILRFYSPLARYVEAYNERKSA